MNESINWPKGIWMSHLSTYLHWLLANMSLFSIQLHCLSNVCSFFSGLFSPFSFSPRKGRQKDTCSLFLFNAWHVFFLMMMPVESMISSRQQSRQLIYFFVRDERNLKQRRTIKAFHLSLTNYIFSYVSDYSRLIETIYIKSI